MSDKIELELSESISQFQRKAFVNVVSQKPDTSIQDLYVLGEKYGLLDMTLGDLTGQAPPSKKGRAGKKAKGNGVDVSTKVKRHAYDEAVLGVVKGQNGTYISAQKIRESAGGSPLQVRKALNRLIEDQKVSFSGQARAMRYFEAG